MLFIETYLEASIPEDTLKHLFLCFLKKPQPKPAIGKDCNVKDVAAVASATVCAPVMHQSAELHDKSHEAKHHGFAERLHGLSEKIHSLGHHRHDSSGGEAGRRSRAGRSIVLMILS